MICEGAAERALADPPPPVGRLVLYLVAGRPTVDGERCSGSLTIHTINWFNTHKLQRLIVQRPLLIEAGSAYISHGDLLLSPCYEYM